MAARLTGEERREKILATSLSLFAKKGFAATKTKDLARAAGVSEAMVFKLFPDKKSLYRALIVRRIAEAESLLPVADVAASRESPERFFRRIATFMFDRIEDDPSFMRLFLFSALEGHPLAAEFDAARAAGLRRAIEEYVRRQQKAGALRDVEPAFASRAFIGIVFSLLQSRAIFREPGARNFSRERLVTEVVTLFLDGMRRA